MVLEIRINWKILPSLILLTSLNPLQIGLACSQIVLVDQNNVLFGNNEDADWGHPIGGFRIVDAAIFFAPPNPVVSTEKYGAVFVGW